MEMIVTAAGRKNVRISEILKIFTPFPNEETNPAAINNIARIIRPKDLCSTSHLMITAEIPDARTSVQKRYGFTRSKGSMHNIIKRKIGKTIQDTVNSD